VFIIWGSRDIARSVGGGTFYCPRCRSFRDYSTDRVENWFTLYFIPLFPRETIAEAVRCHYCRDAFSPEILTRSAEQIEEMHKPWTCSGCTCLNPKSEMRCLNCRERRPGTDSLLPANQTSPTPRPVEEPWQCPSCDTMNPNLEVRCNSCFARRPAKELRIDSKRAAIDPPRDHPLREAIRDASGTSPRKNPTAAERKDDADLAALLASNKCPECGKVNSLVALHCKGCGCRLGSA
jgi:hypothetical protein